MASLNVLAFQSTHVAALLKCNLSHVHPVSIGSRSTLCSTGALFSRRRIIPLLCSQPMQHRTCVALANGSYDLRLSADYNMCTLNGTSFQYWRKHQTLFLFPSQVQADAEITCSSLLSAKVKQIKVLNIFLEGETSWCLYTLNKPIHKRHCCRVIDTSVGAIETETCDRLHTRWGEKSTNLTRMLW